MITKNYIKMCEGAPQLWNEVEHDGSLMAWRSFMGIVHKCKKRKLEGLAAFIPETLVARTWLKDDEDIMVLKTNVEYGGNNPDEGTPIYSQEQLQEMIEYKTKNGETYLDCFYFWASKKYNCFVFGRDKITWNELWLAFVMKEKWNKEWTGSKWVKGRR